MKIAYNYTRYTIFFQINNLFTCHIMKSLSLVSPDVRINRSGGGDGYVYKQLSIISTDKSDSSKSLFFIPLDI